MSVSAGLQSMLWFVAIVAMIPLALWLLKRTPVGGTGGQHLMRTVAVLPLAQNQRLVTVEVGSGPERRWLVLGVTGQQINTLHEMAPQSEAPPPAQHAPFAQLMSRLKKESGGA